MADIKIPGIGPVDKKKALLIGGGTLATIVVVMIRRKSAATTAAAAPATTDPNAATDTSGLIDPSTGVPYADEQNGLNSFNTGAGDFAGGAGNFDAAGYPLGSQADLAWQSQVSGTSATGTTAITTNTQWLEAAEQQLGNTSDVVQALTKVLGGVAVTSAQQGVFLEAVGFLGQPPGGYPPINLTTTAGQPAGGGSGGTTTPPPGTTVVPNVRGMSANNALAALTRVGLVGHLNVERNPKDTYKVKGQTPGGGTKVAQGSTVDLDITP
jgi:PASTA domain